MYLHINFKKFIQSGVLTKIYIFIDYKTSSMCVLCFQKIQECILGCDSLKLYTNMCKL